MVMMSKPCHAVSREQVVPDRRRNQCKGPEVQVCLEHGKNSIEVTHDWNGCQGMRCVDLEDGPVTGQIMEGHCGNVGMEGFEQRGMRSHLYLHGWHWLLYWDCKAGWGGHWSSACYLRGGRAGTRVCAAIPLHIVILPNTGDSHQIFSGVSLTLVLRLISMLQRLENEKLLFSWSLCYFKMLSAACVMPGRGWIYFCSFAPGSLLLICRLHLL